jgi:hypothetical protein
MPGQPFSLANLSFVAPTDKIALERDFNRIEVEGVEPDILEKRCRASRPSWHPRSC